MNTSVEICYVDCVCKLQKYASAAQELRRQGHTSRPLRRLAAATPYRVAAAALPDLLSLLDSHRA